MICRRVCKCEPLLRFNPLNLAKIVCFAKWDKGAKCVSSDFLNEKVLLILTCIILKIKAQLKQNSLKKIYRREFLQSSFIFVIYLLKEVYRKIMSEKYEDLTETGS